MRFIILTSFVLLLVLSCNDNPVTPPNDQPGRRDYTWTVDTIPNYMIRMWGDSPTNVWVVGIPGDFSQTVYHYDGNKWSTDGTFRLWAPHSIYGFNNNNLYIGGDRGKIYKFDGNNWNEVANLEKNGHNDIVFDNMWGESIRGLPYNLFATGAYFDENGYANNSIIAHYSNNKWEIINTDSLYGIIEGLYRNPKDNNYYIRAVSLHSYADSTTLWEYSNGNYHKLYSNIWTQGLQADLSFINGEVYFIMGSKIAIRIDNQFQTILDVNNPNFYQRIWGRNSKDIFLMMTDGLAQYNGTDIHYLFHYPFHTQIFGAALFETDVFFLVFQSQGNLNLVYHGELKNGG